MRYTNLRLLTYLLFSHNLLNPHQSAYRRHHSTETSLLYIHDHLINAIGSQKLSCLCLLDLCCLWYHRPWHLLTRLSSWFGINGSVLDCFRSYLLSRTLCVKCNDCFASLHTSLYGVPQGSVLGPLLTIMYTTPLTTLISSLSLYDHLYTDDTQLFLSFHPLDFQVSITHLQNALTQITSWMTTNLLSLNYSETEFVLIGLKMHAAGKDSQPCDFNRHILSLLATLASYLMNITHSPSRSLHCLNPATITTVLFAVFVPTLTFTPPKRLPQHASPHLWNQLPASLRIPHPNIIIHPPLSDHHLNMPV